MEISCESRGQRGLADIEGHAGMKVADAVSLAVLRTWWRLVQRKNRDTERHKQNNWKDKYSENGGDTSHHCMVGKVKSWKLTLGPNL